MREILLVGLVLSGCVCDGGKPAVCATGDIDCFYAHLSVREVNGMNAKFLEVDTATLDAGVKPSSTTPIAPFSVWAVGTQIVGFDGVQWFLDRQLSPAEKLYGIWGASSNDVWAVGTSNGHQAIYHRDAAGWTAVDAGTPLPGAAFNDVWGSGPNDVWAVGMTNAGMGDRGLIAHWNGAAWITSPVSDPYAFTAVSGSGPNDVWVANALEIRHWDGLAFSVSHTASANGMGPLWANGASDAWAVERGTGPGQVLHWNGSAWTAFSAGTSVVGSLSFTAAGAWGSGPDLWVTGRVAATRQGSVSHWNGATWADATGADFGNEVYGVFGTGPNDVWAASDHGTRSISHWDGRAWQHFAPVQADPLAPAVDDIWAAAPTQAGTGPTAAPSITNQPLPFTLTGSDDAHTIDLQWTDPNPCRPAVCFSLCRVASLRCFARSLCTEPIRDGLSSGGSHYLVSIAAEPASGEDTVTIRATPVSSPDCNPFDELATAGIGGPIDIAVKVQAPLDAGSGAGGGTGSGGGGGSTVCVGGFVGSTRLNVPNGSGGCSATTGAADQCFTSADFTAAGVAWPGACAPSGTTGCFINGTVVKPCCGALHCVVGSACGGDATFGGKCM